MNRRRTLWLLAALLVWCAAGFLICSRPNVTVLNPDPGQECYFMPVAGAWALESGLKIHHDFYSFMGVTYFLPTEWAMKLFGATLQSVRQGNGLLFVGVSILAAALLRPRRCGLSLCILGSMLVSLSAACPLWFCDAPFVIKWFSPDWICVSLCSLCLLGSLAATMGRFDVVLLGVAFGWVAFAKVSYAPVALLLIVSGIIIGHNKSRTRGICAVLVACAVAIPVFASVFNVNLSEMYHDFSVAGHLRGMYNTQFFSQVGVDDVTGRTGLAALWLRGEVVFRHNEAELLLLLVPAFLLECKTLSGFLAGLILLDAAENLMNTVSLALPFLPLAWLVLFTLGNHSRVKLLACLMVIGHLAFFATGYSSEFVYASRPPNVPTLNAKPGERFYMEGNDRANELNAALELLRATGHTNGVASLETFPILPLLLHTAPAKGQPAMNAYWVTFSPGEYQDADTLFRNVQTVMIPKASPCPAQNGSLVFIYQEYLRKNFPYISENQFWVMLCRTK